MGGRVTRTWRSKHVRGLLSLLPLGSPVLKLEANVNYAEGRVDGAKVNWITKFEKKAQDSRLFINRSISCWLTKLYPDNSQKLLK